MVQNKNRNMIDIIDLLFVFLKKIVLIFFVGLIFALGLGGFKVVTSNKSSLEASSSAVNDIFDLSKKLDEETEVQYAERTRNVNHVSDLVNSINVLNDQIENNRKYVANSVFMQIDSENEAYSTANLVVTLDRNQSTRIDLALVSTYRQYILSGEYLSSISEEYNINQGYLTELITASYENSSIMVNTSGDSTNVGVVSITVIGPTIDFTDKIMDLIIDSVDSKCNELNKSVVSHSVSIAARQSSYKVDSTTRDRQINITNRFESLQQQVKNYDRSLETLADDLGIEKSSIYVYFSFIDEETEQNSAFSFKSSLKYFIVGFAIGVFLIVAYISIVYIYSNKFSTQAKFFSRFGWVEKLGVIKPMKKRSKISTKLDIITGDDSDLSFDKSNRLITNNIKNVISGLNKVLVTGTAEYTKIEDFVKTNSINATVKESFFSDPNVLEDISNYDGIIIIEQRDYSKCNLVAEEIKLIENSNTKLLGVIIL